ncbi:DUF4974 domain-containing protein [Sphingobacterium sp. UT-1RO-CII-1]|uniref:FecR family protein n=1 Tax=Sphingobacterium sp. UT-1RO-CII-1 TaxID=2995225 RepID=UPI00227D56AE|nr:FecR family protein [Sphingobacterium sp. UT-1RO-CII-1]MCY4780265.1 DUF4974 domain-containing protein [Sphingobacterium sp. UT-1RO-CII-1]
MTKERLTYLIKQFREGTITEEELHILQKYVNTNDPSDNLLGDVFENFFEERDKSAVPSAVSERIFTKIESKIHHVEKVSKTNHRIKFWYAGAAAAVLLCVLTFLYNQSPDESVVVAENDAVNQSIMPGSSKAVVLLDDGSVIDLEKIATDSTLILAGYTIKKEKEGLLTYTLSEKQASDVIIYNTLVTPRGGEYAVNLPDGTQIFLNAASTLKYPLGFDKSGRKVDLEGEAFFDVKKAVLGQNRIPFSVYTEGQELEVLGTIFNVNSYGQNIQTTLVEGSVKLAYKDNKTYYLKPNQQAYYNKNKANVDINDVDPFYTIAWKTGVFAFEDIPLTTVMETLARWYDVDISYTANVHDIRFTGTISRYENIEKVLELIELTKSLKFKIEGRRVIVRS